ncbi:DNA polymerase III subunit epsilon [Bacillus gaemokensis]|uniref:DNA polymerase III subunit epsilon n=1 Tax=Bacillus gaemokensis TaxID=574375 RepID=A0A073KDI9_9BACI|nr:DNA polymerase III subunit epsilon [Bacillus gaemokensis]KEK25324.1 DNA polymerase III subunit epsilon [Bacillus gaemokensis]KYG37231.1 DNA polymerase III subunit epsilon [Bacillus gaemokensis]
MGLFDKFFGNKKKDEQGENQNSLEEMRKLIDKTKEEEPKESENKNIGLGISINLTPNYEDGSITISSSPVGVSTGSTATDFYVYEWFIKETGEIFYVGKGRGNRYKEYHARAYEAEKIREQYETDSRFVATGLTEDEAIELESKEMSRVLNETNDRLTNRVIPLFVNRDNGYSRSPNTPELKFETAPVLFANEIDEHYFGQKPRAFDEVEDKNLKAVVFITRNIRDEIDVIYGGNLEKYQDETNALLTANGKKILKSKYAKSVSAWIYVGDDEVHNYEIDQQQALEKLGRNVPTYHLIDVWKFLKEQYGDVVVKKNESSSINPVHSRVPLSEIKNLHNWDRGFDEGMPYWEKGDKERKAGNLEKAIELFDKARYNGYNVPALYTSYAMAFRKLKDYDNEIAIIDECIERLRAEKINVNQNIIIGIRDRRAKALELKQKQK